MTPTDEAKRVGAALHLPDVDAVRLRHRREAPELGEPGRSVRLNSRLWVIHHTRRYGSLGFPHPPIVQARARAVRRSLGTF